jgi:pyridinium-3,5-bisthiocarboxylic acid mononucleotide nickel chelatase
MKLAHFDCISGVSGDMTLGALVSAGWPVEALREIPVRLKLEGVEIEVSSVMRGPFAATRVEVRAPGRQPHRHLHHIESLLAAADLADSVRSRALAVFRRLAEAEAEVHGSTLQKVHFHEVGAVDALVDIVGACAGLEALGVESVSSSVLPLGGGTVLCEHGRIPVPAPATALLLRGANVRMGPVEAELATPTGAALLATLVGDWSAAPPAMRLERVGTGAGAREFPDHPNVLRLLLGEAIAAGGSVGARTVAVLETAIDDENPQYLADLVPRLLEAGALDAMLVPALMKKGRPGQWLVVVAEPSISQQLAEMILASTSTLGVRVREERRFELERFQRVAKTSFGEITMKVARLPDGSLRAQPEFESVRQAAERAGRPPLEVAAAALESWRNSPEVA